MSSSGKANAALAAAVVFLLLSSFAAYFAFARLRTSQEWVHHTRDVQQALNQFSTTATRAGRLRAQYVDSGDSALLERQVSVVLEVRGALLDLQRLTADNVKQHVSYRNLVELTNQRIALMDQAIDLKRSGRSTLENQLPLVRQLRAIADATDQMLQGMDDQEQGLLEARQRRERNSFNITLGVLATSLFLALVLFLIHHQLLTEQVTERVRAEGALRALSARLLTVQDEERRRFARELHDSVGQHLAATKMAMSMLEARLPGDRIVEDCLNLLDNAISETRTISHLLHPPLLDEAGLNSACRWFVEGFAQRSGIEVNLDISERGERLSEPIELVLFRILQESLTNVHRHSGAKRAEVSLHNSGNSVTLKVKDYGRGLPAGVLESFRVDGTGRGVGLAGMTQRIREIGGRLEINSNSGGTEVIARTPVRLRPCPPRGIANAAEEVRG
ncbi:MAG: sensor histidine kinase [Candidatus Sulfotelmatobacter sp.]